MADRVPPAIRPALLLCDVGDTLVRWTGYSRIDGLRAIAQLADRPDRVPVDVLAAEGPALDDDMEARAATSLIEYRQADFLRLLFARHGLTLEGDDQTLEWIYWRAAQTFELEPGVEDALERISTSGVSLGVISNTVFGPRSITGELARQGIDDLFLRPIITSAWLGIRKPHPAIFHAAIGLLDADRAATWYVGNSRYHDVGGANAAGVTSVWYNEDGEPDSDAAAVPDITVSSWTRLATLIEKLPAELDSAPAV